MDYREYIGVVQTLANLAKRGCDAVVPLTLAIASGAAAWAARSWWQTTTSGYTHLDEAALQQEP